MPLGYGFHAVPDWHSALHKEVLEESRRLRNQPYLGYGQGSPEKNLSIKKKIDQLIELERGNEFDIIPFSITRTSKPINISPDALLKITQNQEFARRAYEAATGFHNVSRDELEDLRQRASNKYESSLPEIRRFQEERGLLQPEISRITPQVKKTKIESEVRKLESQSGESEKSQLQRKILDLQKQGNKLKENHKEEQYYNILNQIRPLQSRLNEISTPGSKRPSNLESERDILESQNIKLDSERDKLQRSLQSIKEVTPNVLQEKHISNREQRQAFERIHHDEIIKAKELQSRISQIDSERSKIKSRLENISPIRDIRQEQIGKISAAAESPQLQSERLPHTPQISNIAGVMPNPEDIFKRLSISRDINKLQEEQGGSRIAPMNEWHERAINAHEISRNDDTMKLSLDELREAKKHDELKAIEPLIRSSIEDPSDEYMNKYIDDYTKDLRKSLEDESEKEFINKIAPKINMSFAQMGAFHSGARNKSLEKALLEHRAKLRHEIAHLTSSARDKAMEHHELKKRRQQSAALSLGNATKSERDAAKNQAELLRQHAVTKHGLSQLDIAALSQFGTAKQTQQQHEIDARRQEHERQLLYPQEQLAREAALIQGLPSPSSLSITGNLSPSPAPPNMYNLGAGTLAMLTSGIGQQPQQQRTFKKGGSVRKKYADGGGIGSGDIGSEIRKLIHEQGEKDKSRLEESSNYNPVQGWLRHVGREMLSNPSENPLLNLGRGTSAMMDHKDLMHERTANLYDKIQATRLNQYQVLAAYENMKDQNEFRRESFLENKNFHQQQLNLHREKLLTKENPSPDGSSLVNVGGHEFMPISSKKEKEELLKDKKSSESILHDLENIKKLSKEYEEYNNDLFVSPRSPIIGGIASGIQGRFSNVTQNKKMRKAAVTKAVLDSKLEKFKINMETKMRKGVLPEGMRQFMEKKEVFPSSQEPLDIYNKKLEDLLEETKSVYDASKASLKYNIHISPYDLEIMNNKSTENLPSSDDSPPDKNGNAWYEQFGGVPAQ